MYRIVPLASIRYVCVYALFSFYEAYMTFGMVSALLPIIMIDLPSGSNYKRKKKYRRVLNVIGLSVEWCCFSFPSEYTYILNSLRILSKPSVETKYGFIQTLNRLRERIAREE